MPPPVVPQASLVSDVSGEQGHEHPATITATAKAGPLAVQAGLSHGLYTESSPRRLILKVDLTGRSTAATRRPLNLALVFDRSGSMAEDQKFAYAMQAARLVVENLSDRDVISLITFNERATVLSPAGRVVNKDFLYYRLGQFGPEGYTNLSAGLLEAFAEIDSQSADGQLKQVIVLTDGLANRGITDPAKLRNLVATARGRDIGLSTLGSGTEFDETLLGDLATAGGGRYTYVRAPDQIPSAIAAELDGLLAVVAQNARVKVRVAPGAHLTRVYGRLIDRSVSSYSFDLGDVRDGEQSVFLMETAPGEFNPGSTVGVDVTFTFDNPETGTRQEHMLHSESPFTEDAKKVRHSENKSVTTYASVLDAMEKAEEAIQGLDIEGFQEARRLFDRLYEHARRYAIDTRDQQLLNHTFLLKHFMAELSAVSHTGLMHDHREARRRIKKEVDYRRYLMEHHRERHGP
jgi:Ca-activated chloride channel family protein